MSVRVVVTFVPKKLTSNVAWGLHEQVWGLPERHGKSIGADFEWLVICSEVNGLPHGPRALADLWRERAFVTLNIARRDSGVVTEGLQPLWPDEVDAGEVRYTHRFAISSYAEVVQIRAAELPEDLLQAVSVAHAKPRHLELTDDEFVRLLERGGWEGSELSSVPLGPDSIPSVPQRGGGGQGYINDPRKRKAVELYAEDMAIHYLETVEGWTDAVRVGKPYDVRFTRDGAEKRVEVKGTTGAGSSVFLTTNEVDHARANDSGQPIDLVVVSGIQLTPSDDGGYIASGGRLAHYRDYIPADEELRPTQFEAALTMAPSSVMDVASVGSGGGKLTPSGELISRTART
ncbi:protein NO VEIN domain-containing protein [Nocardia salmonicida]|uniref:protein NO VEIN domain-containing protein n=1 Tax=Nocardia salmonicida TaxID=53431 RepID=UPI00366A55AF